MSMAIPERPAMTHTVGKIQAASHQLDWAIRLLIDYDAPIPAITLGAAAEEILGKALPSDSAHEILVQKFVGSHGLERKVISQDHLNRARNWLKHWSKETEPEFANFDLMQEAVLAISRGMVNMLSYDGSSPSEGPRFIAWLRANE